MHQVIRTVCADHNKQVLYLEGQTSQLDNEKTLEEIQDEGEDSDPEAATLAAMEGNQLFAIVNELPSNYREVIVQRYYDDMSYKEIAEALHISVTNVSTRLQRATEAIRKKLEEMDDQQQNINDDIEYKGTSLKASLMSGITMLFPEDVVASFTTTAHEKLFGAVVATSMTTTAATTTVLAKYGGKIIVALVSLVAVAAVTVGTVTAINANERERGSTATSTEIFDYNGSAHIAFVDQEGGASDQNVVEATLIEDEVAATTVEWSLYWLGEHRDSMRDEAGFLNEEGMLEVFRGRGHEIDQAILGSLEPGYYLAVFTLTDENDARGQARRSFLIAS